MKEQKVGRAARMGHPRDLLRHYVTGAIERGEKRPIAEIPADGIEQERAEMNRRTAEPKPMRVLSIDAWRDPDGGWMWNAWHHVGEVHLALSELDDTRRVLAVLREAGFLSPSSAGAVVVEDDGHHVVIMAKGTREPILAIGYAEHVVALQRVARYP